MRLLFVADGRSPIASNWIKYFTTRGHHVHLVSTFRHVPDMRLASLHVVPVAFSGRIQAWAKGNLGGKTSAVHIDVDNNVSILRRITTPSARTTIRQWLGPLTLPKASRRLKEIIYAIKPDLIHAMRIPFEGMLATLAAPKIPLLISVWGNDFTLHASSTPLMASYTRLALQHADAIHTDCNRDIGLALHWGFDRHKPNVVLPGGGGVQPEIFFPPQYDDIRQRDDPIVINPRGLRAYVRNDSFFKAIPLVLEKLPRTRFFCPTMAGEAQAERWLCEIDVAHAVKLLPRVSPPEMAGLFRQAQVAVSPSTHDGTPNTLLEAMACGCLPIAGDIESLREWITHGKNGLLVDPIDPQAVAKAIIKGLSGEKLREQAKTLNARLVFERAQYGKVMEEAEAFYKRLIREG